MTVLCFDLSSGGASAALFDSGLQPLRVVEASWDLVSDESGSATLSLDAIVRRFAQVTRDLKITEPPDAVCIGSFMHNCVLLDAADRPLTPVFTWLDRRGESGLEHVRSRIGDTFHQRTGCRFHPMFPIFKLATLRLAGGDVLARTRRVASIKAFLAYRLTGVWLEDHGMASASGLYNITDRDWDAVLLELAGVSRDAMPPVASRYRAVGRVTPAAAAEFGVPAGSAVINGSGDGFLAHLGSHCESPEKISLSLGTTAAARQTVQRPVLQTASGTFCYQADDSEFLLGCAGNNGGNVLDWGRSIFGEFSTADVNHDLPTFVPLLHGERSPEWDSRLTGSWHGLTSLHSAADLGRSILEAVVFNLAHFVEILNATSGSRAREVVLSGNGFLQPLAAALLARVLDVSVRMPEAPGLASLRGACICALRARGYAVPVLEAIKVPPLADDGAAARFRRYKEARMGRPSLK